MPENHQRLSEIFRSVGQPTVTYVHRKDEKYEETLKSAILSSGQLCLITGPSKTGKTTLYKKVLDELGRQPLVVRCDSSLTANDFWALALEGVNFSRIKEFQESTKIKADTSLKLGGKLGWAWLASMIGEATVGASGEIGENEIRERILARPSPRHLIPLLQRLPICLIVEDYHYLSEETKKIVFQQWKTFIDEQVSVIVIGTTHHAIDIIAANKDLLARVVHIEISRWSPGDLKEIVQKGFDHLKLQVRSNVKELIATESVGLPILTQQCCEQLFVDKGVVIYDGKEELDFGRADAYSALLNLARSRYGQLEAYYTKLVTGPRKRARKYDTYELILLCFAQEPIKFSLLRYEIDERISKIKLDSNKKPPAASIASTLNALGRFQSRAGLELLEWSATEGVLYILEPLFLFYLRCRGISEVAKRTGKISQLFTTRYSEIIQKALVNINFAQLALFTDRTLQVNKDVEEILKKLRAVSPPKEAETRNGGEKPKDSAGKT